MSHAQNNPEISFKTVGFEKLMTDVVLLLFSCHFLNVHFTCTLIGFQVTLWVKTVIFVLKARSVRTL